MTWKINQRKASHPDFRAFPYLSEVLDQYEWNMRMRIKACTTSSDTERQHGRVKLVANGLHLPQKFPYKWFKDRSPYILGIEIRKGQKTKNSSTEPLHWQPMMRIYHTPRKRRKVGKGSQLPHLTDIWAETTTRGWETLTHTYLAFIKMNGKSWHWLDNALWTDFFLKCALSFLLCFCLLLQWLSGSRGKGERLRVQCPG